MHVLSQFGLTLFIIDVLGLPQSGCYSDKGLPANSPSTKKSEPRTLSRRPRSPNAFILYRSHIIANKLYPSEITHQNDISRFVSQKWKNASTSERAEFFQKAEEEKRRMEIEGPREAYWKRRVRSRRANVKADEGLDKAFRFPESPEIGPDYSLFPPSSSSASPNMIEPSMPTSIPTPETARLVSNVL